MDQLEAVNRLHVALDELARQAAQADSDRARKGRLAKNPNKALFPEGLFRQKGRAFGPYIDELKDSLDDLAALAPQLSAQAISHRLEAFENKFLALKRAINQQRLADDTGPAVQPALRAVVGRYRPLYDKLKEYKEYERRLDQKIRELKNDSFMTMQHQAEILRQYQRLGRCRQAITELEERLEALEAAWRH
ncbi:primosomal replication protein PriC [Gallaecimonas pentaromativorans]|uniref:Restart primosome assembly protein PriC n=1 Tax=Gallaecimonas pentaromativorans TaxID=584787 RepID=A0A3N1PFD1_9GAMM|nr:primosomal replication protein PriC [Gallaecimonas pentaromativorans]MED5524403.1 primosomal replication protein PriC [Pseudomonadota bacterium]ROQ30162.1 restart primosome assembly protein PriC [Gallaecimonas pentaromativorans]